MRKEHHKITKEAVLCFFLFIVLYTGPVFAADPFQANIREPVVAGKFYPQDPDMLSKAIDLYLEDAKAPPGARPIALIAPHAGYIFSGQICADAFKQTMGHDYDIVVLLGASHTTPGFNGVSIYASGGYRTPLGVAEIARHIPADLMAASENFTFNASMHAREHSIEVLVPFVQKLHPNAKIVTAILGKPDPDLCVRFGLALAKVLKNRKALIVASSDLSHYPDYEDAVRVDRGTLDAVLTRDPEIVHAVIQQQMDKKIPNLSTCACGEAPILATLVAAKKLGANCARLISYANSGDALIGGHSRVVGYGAVSLSAQKTCNSKHKNNGLQEKIRGSKISKTNQKALLKFARKTIEQYHASRTVPLARGFDPALERKQGAFVTLKTNHKLRGCIGHMTEDLPLCQTVGAMAWRAAFNDRRFKPVAREEMPEIEIEIS
ncbi:AmmeMemoRadiSam system protein B, partial [Thermodesulfobacteriota bacterium]